MTQLVRDLMTPDLVALPADTPVRQAALAMRDQDIGDVLVVDGDQLHGIVTDRALAVRGLAERDDLSDCTLGRGLHPATAHRVSAPGPVGRHTVDMACDRLFHLHRRRSVLLGVRERRPRGVSRPGSVGRPACPPSLGRRFE